MRGQYYSTPEEAVAKVHRQLVQTNAKVYRP